MSSHEQQHSRSLSQTTAKKKKAQTPARQSQRSSRKQAQEMRNNSKKKKQATGKAMVNGKLAIMKVDPYSYATWVNQNLYATAIWKVNDKGKRIPLWKHRLQKIRASGQASPWGNDSHCPGRWDSEWQGCDINAVKRHLDACLVRVTPDGKVGGSLAPKPAPFRKGTGGWVFLPVGPTGGRPPKPNPKAPGPGWLALPAAQYNPIRRRLAQRWLVPYGS